MSITRLSALVKSKNNIFLFFFFFFFNQKTAYEIGTGDWSSDVCSSDLFDLVDVGFLIGLGEAGAAIPSHAEVPDSARINASNVWRLRCWDDASSLPVLVLSCPKLDQAHPDKHGELLRRMLPVLVACNKQAARYGPRATVGVFWEYMSVPQVESRLSGVEYSESIDAAIRSLFAHPFTLVLCVRTPIPAGDYLNKLPYERRGDRLIEQRIARIVKDPGCLHADSNIASI